MTKERFVEWAQVHGWQLDRFGHLRKETEGKTYRFKLSRIAVRHEIKSRAGWVRLKSGYFSKLTITTEGEIAGLTR
jgi:hypothetical protein